jgi:uncharacterized protein YcfL
MLRQSFLVVLATSFVLAGCSSRPAVEPSPFVQQQYCYTDESYSNVNGRVDSRTSLECTDRPAENWRRAFNVADTCREYWYDIRLNNRMEKRRGYVCQKFDGSWEVVPVNM